MDKIFLETANSYKGPEGAAQWDDVVLAYHQALTFKKIYSVINRKSEKVKVTHLPGYEYLLRGKGEEAEDGCLINGQTNANSLLACLARAPETGPGVVYIISANSAHHFSYPLSKKAFEATKNQKKKVVVNFDNHRDYGVKTPWGGAATGATMIQCGGWGSFHLAYWAANSSGGAEYISLCNGSEMLGKGLHAFYSAAPGKTELKVDYIKAKDEDAVLERLRTYTREDAEIYFTVDRDFMVGNGTKYGDKGCVYDTKNGIKFAAACMLALKQSCVIIGQDIIGLPTNDMLAGVVADKQKFADAVANVDAYVKALAVPAPPAKGPPPVKAPKELPSKHPNLDMTYGDRLPGQKPLVPHFKVDKDPTKALIAFRKAVNSVERIAVASSVRVFIFGKKDSEHFRHTVATVLSESEDLFKKKKARLQVTYHLDENDPPQIAIFPI